MNREDFPILSRKINGHDLIYFDNGATSQKPVQVIEAVENYWKQHNSNVHRGMHTLSEESTELYEHARQNVAHFINCHEDELIFTKNATESLNLIMSSWAMKNIKQGDKIVISIMEHHANLLPWQEIAKLKNAELVYLEINDDGTIDKEEYEKINNAKLVSITHVSNVLGTINPVKDICKKAHEQGALCVVDSSQGVPHMKVDVKDIDCDFLAFTGHKMLGPMGIGGLYIKTETAKSMAPYQFGGDMIERVERYNATWADPPARFEAGTPNVNGAVGLSTAVDYLNRIGMQKIRDHEKQLTEYALEELEKIKDITFYGPRDVNIRAGVIPFIKQGWNARNLSEKLNEKGIAIRAGYHCAQPLHIQLNVKGTCRASFYLYNTIEEIDKLIAELKSN